MPKRNILINVTEPQDLGIWFQQRADVGIQVMSLGIPPFVLILPLYPSVSRGSSPCMVALLPIPKLQAAILTAQQLGRKEDWEQRETEALVPEEAKKQQTSTMMDLKENWVPLL